MSSGPGLAVAQPLTVGATAPRFAAAAAGIALVGAAAMAVTGGVDSWWTEAVALVVFAAAGAVLVVGSGPFLAPFRGRTHALLLALLLLATGLDVVARRGGPPALLDGPALVVMPLFLLALAVLRPAREVLLGGVLLAVGTAAATALIDPGGGLAPARTVAAAVAVLAPTLAAAGFAHVALRSLPPVAAAEEDPQVRLSVRQQTIARLEAEALPLLTGVLRAGAMTAEDSARAEGIAGRLRSALLADLARGWLADTGLQVDDPGGYGERMTTEQRTALRTLLVELPAEPRRPGRMALVGQDHDVQAVLTVPLQAAADRRRLAPLVRLLRAAFASADLRLEETEARLVATWSAPD